MLLLFSGWFDASKQQQHVKTRTCLSSLRASLSCVKTSTTELENFVCSDVCGKLSDYKCDISIKVKYYWVDYKRATRRRRSHVCLGLFFICYLIIRIYKLILTRSFRYALRIRKHSTATSVSPMEVRVSRLLLMLILPRILAAVTRETVRQC